MAVRSIIIDHALVLDKVLSLWPSLDEVQRAMVSCHLSIGVYKKNDLIYHQCDSPSQMYILVSGKAKVLKGGFGGRNQIIRVVKPVEMFGYRAHFSNEHHRTYALAFEQTIVAKLPMTVVSS